MDNSNEKRISLLLVLFVIQVFLNWTYVAWVQYVSQVVASGWLTLVPFFAFVYFMLTIIASIELSHKTRFGLTLAGGVLLFGVISDVISFGIVFQKNIFEWVLIPLIALNFALIVYMISQACHYRSN